MPKSCSKCGTHYIGFECPGCLRARVEKLERVRRVAELVRKRDCDYREQGEREVKLDAALAECEEVRK